MAKTQTQIENVRGQDIRVQVRPGDPAVPPLLMCNGIGTSLEALQPLVDALDERIGVVRFDVPGVGGSANPARPYRMSGLAQTVHQLCLQLGYKQMDVFGISWGGGLAQQFAHQYPQFCRRLVLACTGTGMTMVPGQPRVLTQLLSGSRHRDATKAAAVAPMLYGGSMRERPEQARDVFGTLAQGVSKVGYTNQLLAMVGWSSLRWLSQVKQQTLLLFGDDDPIIRPINGRMIHWRMPHSKLVVYPGGHVDVIVDAQTYAPIIGDFLLGYRPPTPTDSRTGDVPRPSQPRGAPQWRDTDPVLGRKWCSRMINRVKMHPGTGLRFRAPDRTTSRLPENRRGPPHAFRQQVLRRRPDVRPA